MPGIRSGTKDRCRDPHSRRYNQVAGRLPTSQPGPGSGQDVTHVQRTHECLHDGIAIAKTRVVETGGRRNNVNVLIPYEVCLMLLFLIYYKYIYFFKWHARTKQKQKGRNQLWEGERRNNIKNLCPIVFLVLL